MSEAWTTSVLPSGHEQLHVPSLLLTVVRGQDKGKRAESMDGALSVGTAASNVLRLDDPAVSRHHIVLEAGVDGVRLRDLSSTNGTVVNGVRVLDAFVSPGAHIVVGKTELRFDLPATSSDLPLYPGDRFGPMLGRSIAMRRAFALLDLAARSNVTVLLLGETGTGKDLAAEAIRLASPRADEPFVVVDCSAIPESLMEAELFGHERGAFTGAQERRVGAFEAAHMGTIFLDEIGELPLRLQPKLLRVLENRVVKPLGSNTARSIDIRVVAATNRDLRTEVNRNTFREDLFFRLSVVNVRIPALRDRGDDVILLAEHFLRGIDPSSTLSPELMRDLQQHVWPGNVRELRNTVERYVALGDAWASIEEPLGESGDDVNPARPFKAAKQRVIERFERGYLSRLLDQTGDNASEAARRAEIDRVHLLKLLRRYGLR